MSDPNINLNIKVIPPLVYAGFFLLGCGFEQVAPAVEDMGSYWPQVKDRIGYLLMVLAGILVIPSMLAFRRADMSFDVLKAAGEMPIAKKIFLVDDDVDLREALAKCPT